MGPKTKKVSMRGRRTGECEEMGQHDLVVLSRLYGGGVGWR